MPCDSGAHDLPSYVMHPCRRWRLCGVQRPTAAAEGAPAAPTVSSTYRQPLVCTHFLTLLPVYFTTLFSQISFIQRPLAQADSKQSKAVRDGQKANISLLRLHTEGTELEQQPLPLRLHVAEATWVAKWRASLESAKAGRRSQIKILRNKTRLSSSFATTLNIFAAKTLARASHSAPETLPPT